MNDDMRITMTFSQSFCSNTHTHGYHPHFIALDLYCCQSLQRTARMSNTFVTRIAAWWMPEERHELSWKLIINMLWFLSPPPAALLQHWIFSLSQNWMQWLQQQRGGRVKSAGNLSSSNLNLNLSINMLWFLSPSPPALLQQWIFFAKLDAVAAAAARWESEI